MRISTKIAIALAGAILLYASFLVLSRYTLNKAQEHERRLNSYYLLEREIANVLIGSRVYRDRLTDADYVENALIATRKAMNEIVEGADKVEMAFLSGMLERVDQYTLLFSKMVQSKQFLSRLDSDVRTDVVRFGELNLKMHDDLSDLLDEAEDDESFRSIRELIFANARLWGWFNRALSVVDRDLLLDNEISRFNANFIITMEAYSKGIDMVKEQGEPLRLYGFDDYIVLLERIDRGLKAISVEFTMAAREDKQLSEKLELHGERLRDMMSRLIERGQAESSQQSDRLGAIFWTAAVAILSFSVIISTWFSLSVSRPIKRLRENFKVVADGNFNLQVPATGKSELDDFNFYFFIYNNLYNPHQ